MRESVVRVWLSVPWLALAGAQLARDIRWGLMLRAVLLFGHALHLIWLDRFADIHVRCNE